MHTRKNTQFHPLKHTGTFTLAVTYYTTYSLPQSPLLPHPNLLYLVSSKDGGKKKKEEEEEEEEVEGKGQVGS